MKTIKGQVIICVTVSDWDEPKRSRHHLMSILARDNRVLFVERPVNLGLLLKDKHEWQRLLNLFKGIRHKRDGLYLFAPLPAFPGGDWHPKINWINSKLLLWSIKFAVFRLKFNRPLLWIFAYNAGQLVGKLNEKISLYYCNDPFAEFAPAGRKRDGLRRIEQQLVKKVDFFFVAGQSLSLPKAYMIPHGVSRRFIDRLQGTPGLPEQLRSIASPRIGYTGVIHGMLDFELIAHVAEHKKDWQIVFVGPIAEGSPDDVRRFRQLCRHENVHYLGGKKHDDLPAYILALDVCLIPLTDNKIKKPVWLPVKFYEYLAAGKPVVSSMMMQGAKDYPAQVVRITPDKNEFIEYVEQALKENSSEHVKARLKLAQQNTWEERLAQIADLINLDG